MNKKILLAAIVIILSLKRVDILLILDLYVSGF